MCAQGLSDLGLGSHRPCDPRPQGTRAEAVLMPAQEQAHLALMACRAYYRLEASRGSGHTLWDSI